MPLGKPINEEVVLEHWNDALRLTASIKTVSVKPSAMLRKLGAYRSRTACISRSGSEQPRHDRQGNLHKPSPFRVSNDRVFVAELPRESKIVAFAEYETPRVPHLALVVGLNELRCEPNRRYVPVELLQRPEVRPLIAVEH